MTISTTDDHESAVSPAPTPRGIANVLGIAIRIVLPIGILAAGVVAYLWLAVEPEKEKTPPAAKRPIRTRVAELRVEDYQVVIKTNGIVQSHNEVALSAEVSGLVVAISPSFDVGAYFEEGEVLIELDSRDYRTAVAVAEAQVLGAESALELAEDTYARNQNLLERNGVSKAVMKQSFAAREQASAQLDTARAQLERAQRDLTRTKLVAPFDGRVRMRNVGIGQTVGPGGPLGVVFAVDYAEVRLPIASKELKYLDLPELATDQPVEVELSNAIDVDSTTVWRGKIVRTEGALDVDSLELFAIARIDDPFGRKSGDPPLRIGQPVVASIAGKILNDVVSIPRTAVKQLDQVYFVDKDSLKLMSSTLEPVWSDEEHLIVSDPTIEDGRLLAMSRIVYAPDDATVEIIPDIELTASTETTVPGTTTKPVSN